MKSIKILRGRLNSLIRAATIASKDGGKEICGLLVDKGYFVELIQLQNKNKKGGGFSFYSRDVRQLEKASRIFGYEILGTFHSHPFYLSKPGDGDIFYAIDDSYMLIIDVIGKKAAMWHIKNKKANFQRFDIVLNPFK